MLWPAKIFTFNILSCRHSSDPTNALVIVNFFFPALLASIIFSISWEEPLQWQEGVYSAGTELHPTYDPGCCTLVNAMRVNISIEYDTIILGLDNAAKQLTQY